MSLLPTLEAAVVDAAERWEPRAEAEVGAAAAAAAAAATRVRSADLPSRRSLRRRWPLVVGGASALAAAGIAGVLVVGIGSSDGPLDLAAEASAAIAPSAGTILYLDLTISSEMLIGGRKPNATLEVRLPQHVEQWSTDHPRRFRMRRNESPETQKVRGQERRRPVHPLHEVSWGDRAQSSYEADRRSLLTTTHLSPRSSASRLPAFPGAKSSLSDLRTTLAEGRLTDRGTAEVDGKAVRRLVGKTGRGEWPGTIEYDIDPSTFEPVRIIVRQQRMPPSRPGGGLATSGMSSTTTVKVNRLERLPLNDQTAQLLKIRPPAGTKIVTRTLGQARAKSRAARRAEERAGR